MTKLSTAALAQQLNAKLEGNKSVAEEEIKEAEPIVFKLDGDDTVRLENVILKQHVEQLTRQLEETRRKDSEKTINKVQDDYQTYLAEKYGVDLTAFTITVDAKTYKLIIKPIPTE